MFRLTSVAAMLLVVAAFSASALATTEYAVNGSFDSVSTGAAYGSNVSYATGWGGGAILVYPDPTSLWYAYSHLNGGQDQQVAQAISSLLPNNTQYSFSADVQAWTDGAPGLWTAAEIRLYFYNSSLGGGWQYLPSSVASYSNGTNAIAWQHISSSFDLPATFNPGSMQCIALWGHTNGGYNQTGLAFNNVSLLGSPIPAQEPPVPEPVTFLGVLLGVAGLGRYVRRRIAA